MDANRDRERTRIGIANGREYISHKGTKALREGKAEFSQQGHNGHKDRIPIIKVLPLRPL
jgi:hypothetical protein